MSLARTVVFVSGYCCSSWRDSRSTRLCLGDGDSGLQPAEHAQLMIVAAVDGLPVIGLGEGHAERHVGIQFDERVGAVEPLGHDADHRERLSIHEHLASDDGRVGVEALRRVRSSEDDDGIGAVRRAFLPQDEAPRSSAIPSIEKKLPVT